jgi:hypothetical protein
VRRLLGRRRERAPVVLTIDDVQWAEPLLLDLIEHLVQWGAGMRLMVLAAARPELRDARSSLASPSDLVARVVTLGGLDAGAATRLAANVIGAEELPAAIAGRVLATSEGNPLFVGELVRMLVHDGILRREGDRWTTSAELATFEMPPTIHALLAARIERLKPAERTILERAAVVGRQFSRAAIANLLPADITDLDARLETLRRSELIEPDTGWLLGEPVMRFHHVLIRDAAYRRVLKGTRAELHARFADWLESRSDAAVEHDETLGWHLEQAHQHLRELGPIDAKGRALGERAARHLGAAGRRALARDDVSLAASLLGRAIDRLDAADPARTDLALDWCEALLAGGDVGPAAAAVEELGRLAAGSDRLRAWHTCFAGQRAVLMDPTSVRPTADAVSQAAETLAAAGDAAGEAKAYAVQAAALGRLGEVGAAEAALDRALAAARRAQDRRRANAVLAGAPLAALWGPEPGDACQRPLPGRRAGAAHHAGSPGGRGRGAPLPGRAGGAAWADRGGAPDDRGVAAHGRGARPHPAAPRGRHVRGDHRAARGRCGRGGGAPARRVRGSPGDRGWVSTPRRPRRSSVARSSPGEGRRRPRRSARRARRSRATT